VSRFKSKEKNEEEKERLLKTWKDKKIGSHRRKMRRKGKGERDLERKRRRRRNGSESGIRGDCDPNSNPR